jgi:phosphoribosyl 1,2-cyclic phosphodiesterase
MSLDFNNFVKKVRTIMLRFISFGSGSSGNCYYIYTDTDSLMIDVGIGIRTLKKHLKNYGVKLTDIRHLLITHDHADHVKSIGSLSTDMTLPVYSTSKVHEGINNNLSVRKKVNPSNVKVVEKNVTIKIGEFMVTPFSVPHDSLDNVGYKIECNGVVFVLMTDIGHVTDEMKEFIGEANYLVIEANHDDEMLAHGPYPQHLKVRISGPNGHLSNKDCATAIAENASPALKHVWLCHLSEENNHPVLAEKTIEQVLRSYGLIVGKDFNVEVLRRKIPSGPYDLCAMSKE